MSSKTKENNNYTKNRKNVQEMMSKTSNRKIYVNNLVTILCICCIIIAIIPLGSILFEVFKNGSSAISFEFLTQKPGSIGSGKGGIGPAIQGTLIVVSSASLIAVPVGVFAGIYLSEYAKSNNKFAFAVRFFADVLTGLPSIIVGIVSYVIIVISIGSFSVIAGAFSLSLIMIPLVTRITEESLKMVPDPIREAAHSLGVPKWKITIFIVTKNCNKWSSNWNSIIYSKNCRRNCSINNDYSRNKFIFFIIYWTCRCTSIEDMEIGISTL